MVNIDINELQELDDNGIPIIKACLVASLFFHKGYEYKKRKAIRDCFNEYMDLCDKHIHWVFGAAKDRRKEVILEDFIPSTFLVADSFDENNSWEFTWSGGEHWKAASEYKISAFANQKQISDHRNSLDFLTIHFPLLFFKDKEVGFPSLLERWAEKLNADYGYGGIGIATSNDYGHAQKFENIVYSLSKRFPGLEVNQPSNHSLAMELHKAHSNINEGIKGGSWITILSNRWVDKLGGITELEKSLKKPLSLHSYNGGVLLLSGNRPEVGDVNLDIDTPNYKKVAKILKPIRLNFHPAIHGGLFNDDVPVLDAERMTKWLNRFDDT